jgi:hypothetical protein
VRQSVRPKSDPDAPEAAFVCALGAREPPVEILLRPGGVQLRVKIAIVRFLIDDEPFRASGDERGILGRFHRRDFEGHARDFRHERADTALEVTIGNELRMLARDEQDVAKTFRREVARFFHHGLDFEGDAQDGVVAREAAIRAIVDALV